MKQVSEMTQEELKEYVYKLQARLMYIVDIRDTKPLLKEKVRKFLIKDVIAEDKDFQEAYSEIAEHFDGKVERLLTDADTLVLELLKEFIEEYCREANPDIAQEGNKRSGTSTAYLVDRFNELYGDRLQTSEYMPQYHFTSRMRALGYRKDKGLQLYPEPRVAQCILGLFPNERLLGLGL